MRAPIALLVVASMSLTGCTALMRASRTPTQPPAPEAWARASAVAAAQVGAGSYAAADRMLADFATQYPGTPEALSATLRRAFYKADPANQAASAHDATLLLDSTLATPLDSSGRADARALRRVTTALERASAAAPGSAAGTNSSDTNSRADESKASSDEVQRLRSELAKANAELERIKKRVAQPKP